MTHEQYDKAVMYQVRGQITWEELVAVIKGRVSLEAVMAERVGV